MSIATGDLVSCVHYSPQVVGVVLELCNTTSKKPTAKILMPNGSVYRFLVDELSLVSKGTGE